MTPAELKAWRAEQGLTQPALAALLGIHEMTVSRWERGEREIPPYLHLALWWIETHRTARQSGLLITARKRPVKMYGVRPQDDVR